MKKRFLILVCLISGIVCSSCDFKKIIFGEEIVANEKITIAIQPTEHLNITSENPITIVKGKNAYFNFTVDDGYKLKKAGNADIKGSRIILNGAQYSQTLETMVVGVHKVYLADTDNDHYEVASENPCLVEDGETATFTVKFDEQYTFESSEDGTYNDGVFCVNNVYENINVSIVEKLKGTIHYQVNNATNLGTIIEKNSRDLNDYVDSEFELKLEAKPVEGAKFVCWTLDGTMNDKMPYSFSRELTYKVSKDTVLYANYWKNNENTIIFDGNGGLTESSDKQVYFPYVMNNRIRVNTIQGSKAFKRLGYQLESWNTEQDGSGERIGLGSRFKISDSNTPSILYAQWIKETSVDNFTFLPNDNGDGYLITSCSSTDTNLVLPNTYNNFPVKTIQQGAFNNLPFANLYFNESLENVEDGAIIDCFNFNELHFFDFLSSIKNEFYSGKKPSRLFINANTDPCYGGSYQSLFARKTDLLLECDSEKFVFIGNSNTLYSIDGQMISEYFNKNVLCYGVQGGVGVPWELIVLEHYCKNDKNIVVFCNEFGSARSYDFFTEHKYYAAESNYDLLSYIDFNVNNFGNIYNAYSTFRANKSLLVSNNYFKNDSNCDKFGCLKLNAVSSNSEDWCSSKIDINFNDYFNGGFEWAKTIMSHFSNSTFLMSCCSFNKNCIKEEIRSRFYDEYQQSFSNSGCKVISSLSNYAFSGNAFTTDNYHLIYDFCVIRTQYLIRDLVYNSD